MYNIPCFYLVIIHSYGTLRTVYEIDATMHILGHSISFAGWPICQWVRKVSLGWLFHSTMLTISYWLTRRVSIYKDLVSYLMSYQSVHFWVLFFVPLFTPFSVGFVLHRFTNWFLLLIPNVSMFVIDIHYKDKPKM